jgi:hypothetical protein
LPDWKGPEAVDRRILERSGQLVMEGFRRGLTDEFASVRKTLAGLTGDLPTFTVPTGRPRGGDGASPGGTNLGGVTFNVYVSGATGRDAGEEAAVVILERLGQARLARG